MKDLIETILKNITTNPDKVVIDQSQEEGAEVYTITVDPEDMGRVIGKSGKVIRAIRTLAHVAGIRSEKRVRVTLAETETGAPAAPSEASATEPAPAETQAAPTPAPTPEMPVAEEETPTVVDNPVEQPAQDTQLEQPIEEPTT